MHGRCVNFLCLLISLPVAQLLLGLQDSQRLHTRVVRNWGAESSCTKLLWRVRAKKDKDDNNDGATQFPTWRATPESLAEQIREAREQAKKNEEKMLQLMFGTPVDALSKNETLLSIAQKRNGTVFQLGDPRSFYVDVAMKLTPNELIGRYMSQASPSVVEASRSIVTNMLGEFSSFAIDTVIISTGRKLATVMFNMQVTGYMLKNAEYRQYLRRSLSFLPLSKPPRTNASMSGNSSKGLTLAGEPIVGEVLLKTSNGRELKVQAEELIGVLSRDVQELRDELALMKKERSERDESAYSKNILTYIQSFPEADVKALTSHMTLEVLEAIQMLVDAIIVRMGVTKDENPDVLLQQSGSGLAQLCMWQLALGYSLRELEVQKGDGVEANAIEDRFLKQGTDASKARLQQFSLLQPMSGSPPAPTDATEDSSRAAEMANALRRLFLRRLGLDQTQFDPDGNFHSKPEQEDEGGNSDDSDESKKPL